MRDVFFVSFIFLIYLWAFSPKLVDELIVSLIRSRQILSNFKLVRSVLFLSIVITSSRRIMQLVPAYFHNVFSIENPFEVEVGFWSDPVCIGFALFVLVFCIAPWYPVLDTFCGSWVILYSCSSSTVWGSRVFLRSFEYLKFKYFRRHFKIFCAENHLICRCRSSWCMFGMYNDDHG